MQFVHRVSWPATEKGQPPPKQLPPPEKKKKRQNPPPERRTSPGGTEKKERKKKKKKPQNQRMIGIVLANVIVARCSAATYDSPWQADERRVILSLRGFHGGRLSRNYYRDARGKLDLSSTAVGRLRSVDRMRPGHTKNQWHSNTAKPEAAMDTLARINCAEHLTVFGVVGARP